MEPVLNGTASKPMQDEDTLHRILDRGIDDMEAGRELPADEAFKKITELRNGRRNARA